ncbi:hypothetical protein DdX_06222 [Ditylenchus destructor]|uniref:Uncharacterized protein n=1 Tax=Ditylenchus destructor TaxID=166010 RepID=A0AAD4R9R7_9BILA|nr:hypothetical protein DdX_06222 [Ditylenchus destructor]
MMKFTKTFQPSHSCSACVVLLASLAVLVHESLAQPSPHMTDLNRYGPEKKSADLGADFMSAMNGATRLRYGKRSNGLFYNDLLAAAGPVEVDGQAPFAFRTPSRWATAKRMASFSDNIPALVDQLNGAERLRFGRK